MLHLIPQHELRRIDKLLIYGRGVHRNGELTPTGYERSEIAVELGKILRPKLIMWSGGRSWRQALAGVEPPSEGRAGMQHAIKYGGQPPEGCVYDCEEDSESTVKNVTNSASRLNMQPGEVLGILSDYVHFAYGRPQYIAKLAFPENEIVPIQIPRLASPADLREERRTAIATKVAMAGVRPGDLAAMDRRQERLEDANAFIRSVIGFAGRPNELEEPDIGNFSYRHVEDYEHMTPPMLAGVLAGRAA